MSAQAGWYPDPGGGQGLYRFWDGRAWSAATSPNPAAPPPVPVPGGPAPGQPGWTPGSAQVGSGVDHGRAPGLGPIGATGAVGGQDRAYADYRASQKSKTPVGWWLGAGALLVVIVLIAAFVLQGLGGRSTATTPQGGQASQDTCPTPLPTLGSAVPRPNDGRVHGGPLSYPALGSPWGSPTNDTRVPFGTDVATQVVTVEPNYAPDSSWVASVLVGELRAGDGFYTPKQGAQVVVKCILGAFYGNNEVKSNVKVNRAIEVDGRQGWLVESQLTFDIPNLRTKGELLIVAIVATDTTSGLYYASIPDTRPELVQPARDALRNLRVDP